jgi:hypothetical protein
MMGIAALHPSYACSRTNLERFIESQMSKTAMRMPKTRPETLCIRMLTFGHKTEDAIPANRRNRKTASHGEFSMLSLTNPPHLGQAVLNGVEDSYHRLVLAFSTFRSSRKSIICPQHGHGCNDVGENNV